jgi:hypothetical protein
MRCGRLLLAALLIPTCGCSTLIAKSGKNIDAIATREDAREKLGTPDSSSENGDLTIDTYQTRQKISEWRRGGGEGTYFAMSFGLTEFAAFPTEVYILGRRTVLGQELSFHYDATGKVVEVYLDGEKFSQDDCR